MPEIHFNGPDGRLEGRYHRAIQAGSPIAIVLHPHPQLGGTMNNKVVYAIYHAFAHAGFSVLRFNYRGVGRSQGSYDNGLGELADAAAALDWMQTHFPGATECWVGGFSFGAWISMQLLMRRPDISGFVAVAPPANHYDFAFLAPCPSSGLIIHGSADQHVPTESVDRLVQRLASQRGIGIGYRLVEGATHFFDAQLEELTAIVGAHLKAKRTRPGDVKESQRAKARSAT
ncbi:MAG: alpha/beta fold hydrolase [Alphaproteobacteria bacterium]|nr:alpha/beta fold hydrolase [Alphaproteobacteria bacterium]